MKKIIYFLSVSTALLFASFVNAEVKIGVVDVMSVLQRMPQRESVGKALDSEFEARAKSLQAEEKKANEAAARLKKDGLTLSSSEKTKLNKTISDFENKAKAFSADYRKRETEEAEKLLIKIQEAIKDIVAKEKYDIILKAEATLSASDAVDISDKVLEKVKK
ncbi:MAG: OmpH family outer membrane protein [Gilliamella sp.]|uniref:OmpH family outer membrane protein n=1 Tax=unclassified Gilliamella TaxID=2685620 RepID=UPI00080DD6B0|nr:MULTISPECIES: OmpH family outer membrane protein [Gilliamella]NUE95918.1 molecular chaperone [Gilliamella sp. ESL0232]MCO6536655.1 OmpH family outer membrane protein [Gilliamella sp.]MCO6538580.1 OmpH family outer membrane protein [Gilliamella sp.]MCO6549496.1 OmpH family outer membrane protein [Gilliamella sp.]MCO6555653.1 OmpH family outer membrane protein [Gilliamella sp.]